MDKKHREWSPRFLVCSFEPEPRSGMGSARAPHAVFRALVENLERMKKSRTFWPRPRAKRLDARRVQPHPRAGVLPNFGVRVAVGSMPKRWRATRTPRRWRVRRTPRASGCAPVRWRLGPNGPKRSNHPASAGPTLCHMPLAYSRHYSTREEKTDVPQEPICRFFADFFPGGAVREAENENPLILLGQNGLRRWAAGGDGGANAPDFKENP